MVVIDRSEIKGFDLDGLAIRVFLKALEILGGPRKLVELRNLTWITSLMEASYAVVMWEELNKTEDEIAEFLGLSRQTVRNILKADPELVMQKIEGELKDKTHKAHTAGGLAKYALREIKAGRDNLSVFMQAFEQAFSDLGVEWPVHVLRKLKGTDFPISRTDLSVKLKGLKILGTDIEKILSDIEIDMFESPRDVLRSISERIKIKKIKKED